jgi:hypothetical protein
MKIFKLVFVLAFLSNIALSDGIPVNKKTGGITVPHSVLKLSNDQIEEIETVGTLTLTESQWKQFRAIGANCPKRFLNILPITWDDCTCDMSPYAIQLSYDSIAIIHGQISCDVGVELKKFLMESTENIKLKVDRQGQFYYGGVLIPFDSLLKILSESEIAKFPDAKYYRYFSVEPPYGFSVKSPQLQSQVQKLFNEAKRVGLKVEEDQQ